jgi:hypothetical protein
MKQDASSRWIAKASVVVVLVAGFVFTAPRVASAESVQVSGTFTETSPGTCGQPVETGMVVRVLCVGLEEIYAGGLSGTGVFDEAVTLNVSTGRFQISGTETFVGCLDGSCGTLEWVFHGTGTLDLATFTIISAKGVNHLTGGTGDLANATGAIRFSLIGVGPATYEGFVVL